MLRVRELDQTVRLYCPECADERPFEQPECLDGHGADCPERACVECGAAVLVAPLTQLDTGRDARGAHAPDPAGQPAARLVRPSAGSPSPTAGRSPAAADAQPEPRRRVGAGQARRSLA
ncbi:hypothetical protein I6A84_06170 [Frankia sp. CNm7]|uniref:Uncharacterized protein n=1 Tax=Frankia nepalensis TaxID=1836974 RepID=A0A937UQ70_9ACTN|nr:hypothetical protein [Frankia nepalensis]MBL7499331.1 hypothetical protein [Frankia nepalensis]MBL7514958.1 hypothetical protein [Frankia nepalensis]MBL7517722.1 hypothetical protein [Frankia nepalensis]MBL7629897.1 hypothetical protein [Frankia nepalensis]